MTTRAVIYARVSTDEQAEHGYSLPSQLEACRNYAERHEFVVIEEYKDDCSGAMLDRPGLERLRDLTDNEKVQAVIVYADDRLSRNLAHSILIREEWRKAGIELHIVVRGKSDDTAEGRLTENIQAVIAEYEREKILERTRRGKMAKARDGHIVLNGIVPYGYQKRGKGKHAELVIDETEAQVVRNIFEWYINGNGQGRPMSLRQIAFKLDELGIPTPNRRKKSSKYWLPTTLRLFMKNEIYIGRMYYGKSRQRNGKREKQPRDKWILIEVQELAIIDKDTFYAVQARAERNAQLSKRNRKRKYLLTGFIRCGACKMAVIGHAKSFKNGPYICYRCGTFARKNRECPCSYRYVATHIVDTVVWDWLESLITNDVALAKGLRVMAEKSKEDLQPKKQQLATIRKILDESEARIRRLVTEMGKHDDEVVLSALREEIKALSKQNRALVDEAERLEAELVQVEINQDILDQIMAAARKVRDHFSNGTYENKRFLLDALGVQVILHSETKRKKWIEVICRLPGSYRKIELNTS